MRIAVMSDVHGNYLALKACLDYIGNNQVDYLIYLGDYITDYPSPEKTLNLMKSSMQQYPTSIVKGNREDYILSAIENKTYINWEKSSMNGMLLCTYQKLSYDDIEFMKAMPSVTYCRLDGCAPITIAHKSPIYDSYYLNKYKKQILENIDTKYLLIGHTHSPMSECFENKYIYNPGSVGMVSDGSKKAQLMFLDWDRHHWKERFIKVDYDYQKMAIDCLDENTIIYGKQWSIANIKNLFTGRGESTLLYREACNIANGALLKEMHYEVASEQLKNNIWFDDFIKMIK